MLTVHAKKRKNKITIPEKEFFELLKNYQNKQYEPVEIVFDDDGLEELPDSEIAIRKKALEEFQRGDTIKFRDVKEKWLQGKNAGI